MTDDLDELSAELSEFRTPKKAEKRSPVEARVVAGFEDIVRFVDEHSRAPQHGDGNDIFERLYAVRLDRIRANPTYREWVGHLDTHGLLAGAHDQGSATDELDDSSLAAELGELAAPSSDITRLQHVRSSAEKRAAEEIANRSPCEDFSTFAPKFEAVKQDLDVGVRESRRFEQDASVATGDFFILGGQLVYVAEVGEEFETEYDKKDRRLRVIYDNATESNILKRSLQRALYKDEAGRRITDPGAGPLFGSELEDGDAISGTLYVLRSLSDDPAVSEKREFLHKIGFTAGNLDHRLAGAEASTTYLCALVEVAASYRLVGISPRAIEGLFHRLFDQVRFDITMKTGSGQVFRPREWFLVPLDVIGETVDRIADGTIARHVYDPKTAKLVEVQTAIE